jgi:hypothetical protein
MKSLQDYPVWMTRGGGEHAIPALQSWDKNDLAIFPRANHAHASHPGCISPRNCGTHRHLFCITWLHQLLQMISFQIFDTGMHLLGLNAKNAFTNSASAHYCTVFMELIDNERSIFERRSAYGFYRSSLLFGSAVQSKLI